MKRILILCLMLFALILCANAIDNKYLHQLAHIKGINALAIEVTENQVFARSQNQLWIYTIFNPWQPRMEAGFLSTALIEDINVMSDNYIFFCSQEASNTIVSIDSLNSYGRIYFTNSILGDKITREGSMLYVADRYRGIDFIYIGSGGLREIKSTFSEKWGIRDFHAQYPYLYALNDFGLVTVDITDQQFPVSLGTNYQISDARSLVKNGDTIWIGAGKELLALNVRDLSNPVLVNQFRLSNDILDMEIKDDRLFLALGKGGVKILDVKNPLRIADINTIFPQAVVYDIALDKDLILLALGRDGWMIFEYR
ncbi:MAG: hypothetical protein Q8M98_00250 [Candidatus Cloacimonadaceae bacterium]|nr:hypothetical protein [Candidatus Cloacimonadaceae bacterium]MDP3113181.1 hypothetical protein [Candidatus Cloacimonadaceae bacterium]